jgi:hypothetical protein
MASHSDMSNSAYKSNLAANAQAAAARAAEEAKHHCDGWGCVGSFADGFANGFLNMPGNTIRGLAALPSNPGAALEAMSPMAPVREALGMGDQALKGDWYGVGQTTGDKAASAAVVVATLGAGEAVAALKAGSTVAEVADGTVDAASAAGSNPIIKIGASGGDTAGLRFPQSVRAAALDENPGTCVYCRMTTDGPQVDHAVPRSVGGDATIDNAQTTCPFCNASKGARDFPVNPPPGYRGLWPPSWWPAR